MDTTSKNPATPFTITGDWSIQSNQLKTKFTELTDEDLAFEAGKENELITRLSSRLKKGREETIHLIKKAGNAEVQPEAKQPEAKQPENAENTPKN